MKKQRIQPSFASLTEAEFNQLVGWVERETYAIVLDRVRKPRSEGGYGLNISRGPLERLYKKKSTLDDINRRLNSGHALSLADVEAIKACDQAAPEEVHDAIMSHAYDRASSAENTPAQLLSLQRLADFPARAELRAQKAGIEQSREERAQRKDQRAQAAAELAKEMHTHKISLALRKEVSSVEMNLRKQDRADRAEKRAAERLDLAKRSLTLREQQSANSSSKLSTENSTLARSADHLGPLAKNWEDVRERARKAFGITPEESARRAELRRTWVDPSAHLNTPAPAADSSLDADSSCEPSNSPASCDVAVATEQLVPSPITSIGPIGPIFETTTAPTLPTSPSTNRTTPPLTRDQRLAEFYKGIAAQAAANLKTLNAHRANQNQTTNH